MNEWIQIASAAAPSAPAQSGSGSGGQDPMSGFISLLPLALIFVLFYILFIVPQRKQQKQHEALLKALKKGDEVVTSGGMFGTIVGFNEKDNTIFLKLGDNVKIEIQRSSVTGLRKTTEPAK